MGTSQLILLSLNTSLKLQHGWAALPGKQVLPTPMLQSYSKCQHPPHITILSVHTGATGSA